MSPMRTGAVTSSARTASITSKILSFGTSGTVFAATTGRTPPSARTVLVTVRTGAVASLLAYSAPRGQVLPVTETTCPFSISTWMAQPIGQRMQVSSMIYSSSTQNTTSCAVSPRASRVSVNDSISPGAMIGFLRWEMRSPST